jgi:hypothetical protein
MAIDKAQVFTRMSRDRFEALTLWGLDPEMGRDLVTGSCWRTTDETVLAGVVHHIETRQFWLALFRRNEDPRFRFFGRTGPYPTARLAEAVVSGPAGAGFVAEPDAFAKFPPPPKGVDPFATMKGVSNFNSAFLFLRDAPTQSAARAMVAEVARWKTDTDGNFVKDFQTTGYSARVWELYLFAAMRRLNFEIDPDIGIPDFCLTKGEARIFVEAVTANAKDTLTTTMMPGAPSGPPENFWRYIEEDMPLKLGSPLFDKMKKRYWEMPHVAGHPFVLAIADFHAPASMVWSHTAVPIYLFGTSAELKIDSAGRRVGVPKPVTRWGKGTKDIATPFFWQKDTEHVSAVLFSNAGTISKFNRMGVRAGFGDPFVSLVRAGGLSDPRPDVFEPTPFKLDVESPEYSEDWQDELEMYHNPNALLPIDESLFPGMAHHRLEDGEGVWRGPSPRVLFSQTITHDFGAAVSVGREDEDQADLS